METVHLESVIAAALFIGVRIGGLMLFAPFLGSESLPTQIKIALTIALTVLLYPVSAPLHVAGDVVSWVAIAAGEFLIGLVLGLAVQFVMEAAQIAGQVIGVQAGYSLVTLLDPQTQADTPVLATFNQLMALLIFLSLNAHHWLLRGLASSFAYLPPGQGMTKLKASGDLLQAAGGMWLAGVQMAAPVVVATLLVDVTLGFLSKAAPQMPVLFVGLSLKTLLALTVLAGSLIIWPRFLESRFASGIALGERLLHLPT
ncbi:MAG TPA: flagellar biosynthetic protein FliR [Terriglobales bacterium]|nr:flagellar biosynthetic protein FliR [Terriglobales bacterium]